MRAVLIGGVPKILCRVPMVHHPWNRIFMREEVNTIDFGVTNGLSFHSLGGGGRFLQLELHSEFRLAESYGVKLVPTVNTYVQIRSHSQAEKTLENPTGGVSHETRPAKVWPSYPNCRDIVCRVFRTPLYLDNFVQMIKKFDLAIDEAMRGLYIEVAT
ncbi:hypothetical protein TNCV_4176321 [Trichonephila clavipes]|nr:hypothetical protein TNCV_4176321 [Trichonephila clavipes]